MSVTFVSSSNQALDVPGPVMATANKSVLVGMCWVRLAAFPTADDSDFIQYSTGVSLTQSRYGMTCALGTGGRVTIKGRATDAESLKSFTTGIEFLSLGVWLHIAGVVDYADSHAYFYMNGDLEDNGPMSAPCAASQTAATPSLHGRIGGGLTSTVQGIDGELEDVRLYDFDGLNKSLIGGVAPNARIQTIYSLRGRDSIVDHLMHRFTLKDLGAGSVVLAANIAEAERIVAVAVNAPTWNTDTITSLQKLPPRRRR
jgi:hypothetical protein